MDAEDRPERPVLVISTSLTLIGALLTASGSLTQMFIGAAVGSSVVPIVWGVGKATTGLARATGLLRPKIAADETARQRPLRPGVSRASGLDQMSADEQTHQKTTVIQPAAEDVFVQDQERTPIPDPGPEVRRRLTGLDGFGMERASL